MSFDCDKCGECCRNLDLSELFDELNDGTGKCKYLSGNICSIYENRPVNCRIDDCYDLYFKNEMSKEEYYFLNRKVCNELKKWRDL